MKKTITTTNRIQNLYGFLKLHTQEDNLVKGDEIVMLTTQVMGGWDDNKFDANQAGFSIQRFNNPAYEANHTFSECYRITKR